MSTQSASATDSPARGADVLIAVDVGTSGARASAFDVSGAPLRGGPAFLPDVPARGGLGRAGRPAMAVGRAVRARRAGAIAGSAHQVRAVAVTGQCPSVVPLDRA